MKEKTYPVSYEVFKKRIIEIFIETEWDYITKFTKEEKVEFVENTDLNFKDSYKEECENYDKGFINVFTTPEDTHKYVMGLLFECDMYFASKTSKSESCKLDEIDESKYPLTFKQFKEKMIELLIKSAGSISNIPAEKVPQDVEEFLKEQPTYLIDTYKECCQQYDNASKYSRDKYFSDVYLDSMHVWYWGMWMDYWFFL